MKRPNLVNPQNWTPFQSIPIPIQNIPLPINPEPKIILTKTELIKRNSVFLNVMGIFVIFGISYFLYSIYLERKIFTEYLEYVKENNQNDNQSY